LAQEVRVAALAGRRRQLLPNPLAQMTIPYLTLDRRMALYWLTIGTEARELV
jgi:hypothetical protein